MQSEFSRDLVDPDKPIKDVVAARPGLPIKLRVQPMVCGADRQYRSWKQVSWTLECDDAAEAYATRDAMELFFQTLSRVGPQAVRAALQTMQSKGAA